MSGWQQSGPVSPIWPPDRFEVRSARPIPDFRSAERYAFAPLAQEAVARMREAQIATQIQVIRLDDGVVLFDLAVGVEAPPETW
ncbi:hypothetical protein Pth03_46380 [Planotetraspora thailandica]|uniref:Uncharacterized protein n=1 Tax=Planotetraspora thailandica TaxID=487172 RepID=A0A8J3V8Z8_9ACTN|nr:hypothetical protein Pth03_46380 [Planotetraspora thailandica]